MAKKRFNKNNLFWIVPLILIILGVLWFGFFRTFDFNNGNQEEYDFCEESCSSSGQTCIVKDELSECQALGMVSGASFHGNDYVECCVIKFEDFCVWWGHDFTITNVDRETCLEEGHSYVEEDNLCCGDNDDKPINVCFRLGYDYLLHEESPSTCNTRDDNGDYSLCEFRAEECISGEPCGDWKSGCCCNE